MNCLYYVDDKLVMINLKACVSSGLMLKLEPISTLRWKKFLSAGGHGHPDIRAGDV